MTDKELLVEEVKSFAEKAKLMYKRNGEVSPALFADCEKMGRGQVPIMLSNPLVKQLTTQIACEILRDQGCKWYVFISEAWILETKDKSAAKNKALIKKMETGEIRVSQHPDAVEVIVLQAENKAGDHVLHMIKIKGGSILGEEVKIGKAEDTKGLFSSIFESKESHNAKNIVDDFLASHNIKVKEDFKEKENKKWK